MEVGDVVMLSGSALGGVKVITDKFAPKDTVYFTGKDGVYEVISNVTPGPATTEESTDAGYDYRYTYWNGESLNQSPSATYPLEVPWSPAVSVPASTPPFVVDDFMEAMRIVQERKANRSNPRPAKLPEVEPMPGPRRICVEELPD